MSGYSFRIRLLPAFVPVLAIFLSFNISLSSAAESFTLEDSKTATPIPRANPGYVQLLEKQSMLGQAAGMAKIVSGSDLGWRASADDTSPAKMLDHADTWVDINPLMLLVGSRVAAFEYLADSRFWAILRAAGVDGLYLAPTGGSGRLWAKNTGAGDSAHGEDIVQYDFSDIVGSERNYNQLMSRIVDQKSLIGSDLIPAATGLGPDFFLATRNVREYPGTYCLVEVPSKLWPLLPAASSEWIGVALPQSALQQLSAQGFLPSGMLDQKIIAGKVAGWAVTGEIPGIDSSKRRWIYRYYGDPSSPVLNWEDPSRAANRILSGSAVRQVGMLGQSLVGLKFDAFHSLESSSGGNSLSGGFGPTLSAAQTMSREVGRYGAWSWLQDQGLTIRGMQQFLNSGPDFVTDSALSPAAEHALLTGNAVLLRYMADKLLESGTESHRLVHTMPTEQGIDYSLTSLRAFASQDGNAAALYNTTMQELATATSGQSFSPVKNNMLYTTSVGLAAMSLRVPADAIPQKLSPAVAKGHALLILFKAMQPGIIMLSGQDFVGSMPLAPRAMEASGAWDVALASRGSYALTDFSGSYVKSGQGIAKTQNAYAPADLQVQDKNSFINQIGAILKKRTESGVAKGRLVARPATRAPGAIALLTQLPNGKHILTVCNFSRKNITEAISLPGIAGRGGSSPLAGDGRYRIEGSSAQFNLGPWQGKAIIFQHSGKLSSQPVAASYDTTPVITAPSATETKHFTPTAPFVFSPVIPRITVYPANAEPVQPPAAPKAPILNVPARPTTAPTATPAVTSPIPTKPAPATAAPANAERPIKMQRLEGQPIPEIEQVQGPDGSVLSDKPAPPKRVVIPRVPRKQLKDITWKSKPVTSKKSDLD